MPRMTSEHFGPEEPEEQRFKVTATGDTGTAMGPSGLPNNISRSVSVGPRLNVGLVDLLMDDIGEVRTFEDKRLERITE